MSDGSLSQDEIDALLMGDAAPEASEAASTGSEFTPAEKNAILGLFGESTGSQSAALSGIMVKNVTMSATAVEAVEREPFLASLPDEVVEVKINYTSGLSGVHMYVMGGDDALKIATPMIGQDDLELDGTAISAVSEAMSQLAGVSVTAMGEKIDKTILTDPPSAQSLPKAMLSLPQTTFVQASFDLQIEGQGGLKLYEIFELPLAREIAAGLGAAPASPTAPPAGSAEQVPGAFPADSALGGSLPNAQGGFQQMAPAMGAPMMGGYGAQNPLNVQGVQLPELSPSPSTGEQRNIGLLMDVSMELTVELGRTKWKIKDILGMGEGTIIELDKLAGEPVDILVNNNLIARGEVVVIDENFGVRVTEIVSTMERMTER